MNYHQAKDLLDRRRAGADMPQFIVRKALEMTGDLDPLDDSEWTLNIVKKSLITASGSPRSIVNTRYGHLAGTANNCHGLS